MSVKEYEEKLVDLIKQELDKDRNPFDKINALGRMTMKSISVLQDKTIEKIKLRQSINEELAEIEDEYEQLYTIVGMYGGMKDFAGMNYMNERFVTAFRLNEMNFDIYKNAYERSNQGKTDRIGIFK